MDIKPKIEVDTWESHDDKSFLLHDTKEQFNPPATTKNRKRKVLPSSDQRKKKKDSSSNEKKTVAKKPIRKRQTPIASRKKRVNATNQAGVQTTSKNTDNNEAVASFNAPNDSEGNIICPPRTWNDEDLVSETTNVSSNIAKNVIKLLDQDCTVPFIARYRKEMCGNCGAEKIRDIEMAYENVKALHKKVNSLVKTLSKEKCDQKVIFDMINAKTIEEVEYLYAPFKPGSKRSLAERARELGLEQYAQDLIKGRRTISLIPFKELIDENIPGKSNETEIMKGIQNIIADIVAKNREILDFIRNNKLQQSIQVSSNESNAAKKEQRKAFVEGKETQNYKFENYFNFNVSVRNISSHQVLALNRGENLKVLTVKLIVPPFFKNGIIERCQKKFSNVRDSETREFIDKCLKDAYDRLLEPHISRQIRSELTKKASKESVSVFCSNLKHLLLTPPIRGKTVIGIDPGFTHGCKVAVISPTGEVLKVDVLYLHNSSKAVSDSCVKKIVGLVLDFEATVIAIGNGTACRETEMWLSNLIKSRSFQPHDVKYCIVDESGISIYSVTKEAEAELPNLDPNLRSAVAIARRLQDPLLEYVKVEPKHLGVGMYQHDIAKTALKNALESVVVECVSFVGVDLNVCPEVLLKKISGLSASKVKNIILWRETQGPFINRKQLLEVKGLGQKSFEQCAGFVKIFPQTSIKSISGPAKVTNTFPNRLDLTIIHPESYEAAEEFLSELKVRKQDVGSQEFVNKVEQYMKFKSVEEVANNLNIELSKMQLIVEAFKQVMTHDIRAVFDVPLFKTEVQSMDNLKCGQILSGRVANVTHFGAFVDIGVGVSGLIHTSKMKNQVLQLGNRVSVRVLSIDIARKRIALTIVI